jgi:hypothetical protein
MPEATRPDRPKLKPKPQRRRTGTRQDWSRRTEAASLKLPAALLAEARANSKALEDASLLAVLAREVALTRGTEITLAYRNVILVTSGFKKSQRRGAHRLTNEPCVVFVVRRKWSAEKTVAEHPQHLPRWLVAYAEHGGSAAVCPGYRCESAFFGARGHGAGRIWLEPQGAQRANAIASQSRPMLRRTRLLSAQLPEPMSTPSRRGRRGAAGWRRESPERPGDCAHAALGRRAARRRGSGASEL